MKHYPSTKEVIILLRKRLQEILEVRNMSQAELAKKSNVSPGLISEILSGKRKNVSLPTLKKIAKGVGIDVKFFLEPDIVGPREILGHLTEEEKLFVIDEENAPFIRLTAQAARKGLTPKQLEFLIRAVVENSR